MSVPAAPELGDEARVRRLAFRRLHRLQKVEVYEATFEEPPGQVFFEGGSGSRDARRGGTLGSAPRTIYGISSP